MLEPIETKEQLEAYIRATAPEYGLLPDLCVRQCMAESSLNVNVHDSRTGAIGVMQLEPIEIEDLKLRFGFVCDPRDPRQNVRGSMTYTRWLMQHYKSDARKAYAAYNWGQGDVDGAIRTYGATWEEHLPAETRAYVAKIVGGACPTCGCELKAA